MYLRTLPCQGLSLKEEHRSPLIELIGLARQHINLLDFARRNPDVGTHLTNLLDHHQDSSDTLLADRLLGIKDREHTRIQALLVKILVHLCGIPEARDNALALLNQFSPEFIVISPSIHAGMETPVQASGSQLPTGKEYRTQFIATASELLKAHAEWKFGPRRFEPVVPDTDVAKQLYRNASENTRLAMQVQGELLSMLLDLASDNRYREATPRYNCLLTLFSIKLAPLPQAGDTDEEVVRTEQHWAVQIGRWMAQRLSRSTSSVSPQLGPDVEGEGTPLSQATVVPTLAISLIQPLEMSRTTSRSPQSHERKSSRPLTPNSDS